MSPQKRLVDHDAQPLKRLRADPGRNMLSRDDYSFGWVAALPIEMAAAKAVLDERHEPLPQAPGDRNNYCYGRSGSHNVVIATLPADGAGTVNASMVANNMHRSFPGLRGYLMVGIAGGAGERDVRLGDVVVGTTVIQYDLGRAMPDGSFELKTIPLRPSMELRAAIASLEAQYIQEGSRIPDIIRQIAKDYPVMKDFTSKELLQDRFFDSTYDHVGTKGNCDSCDVSKLVVRQSRPNSEPKIHKGMVASGDTLVKSTRFRDQLIEKHEALCFEMESAGFIENLECLAIRSICDYADSHKNDQWQKYAAATAAAYAKELLGQFAGLETQSSVADAPRQEILSSEQKKKTMELLYFPAMYDREYTISQGYRGTCEWILGHPSYSAWLNRDNYHQIHGFLWIRGKPGAGKSTLMKFILTRILKQINPIVVSFFFNARGVELEKSFEGMYRSLLYQLLEKIPGVELNEHRYLVHLLRANPKPLNGSTKWNIGALQDIISTLVAKLGRLNLIFLVDALDECQESKLQNMVDFFASLGEATLELEGKVFTCFSSRHYPSVIVKRGIKLNLDNEVGHRQALEEYVNTKLDIGEGHIAKEIKSALHRKASGVFLWAVLAVQILNEKYEEGRLYALHRILDDIPSELNDLFKSILNRDQKNADELLLSVQWILHAREPLTLAEYYSVMVTGLDLGGSDKHKSSRVGSSRDTMVRFVSSSSKGLAEITKSKYCTTVQFIHESVRDFLLEPGHINELWPGLETDFESRSHDRLKECCRIYVHQVLRQTETMGKYGVGDARDLPSLFPLIIYATRFIFQHAERAAAVCEQQKFLQSFTNDFPGWLKLYDTIIRSWNDSEYKPYAYGLSVGMFYVLADQNCPHLVNTAASYNPDVHVRGGKYDYPLFAALFRGSSHKETVDVILSVGKYASNTDGILPPDWFSAPINGKYTPLSLAAKAGHKGLVNLLLDKGADPNVRDPGGSLPTIRATEYSQWEILKLLLDRGANIDLKDNLGNTPLLYAAGTGQLEAIELLLERGADIESKDNLDQTPLLYAAFIGQLEAVELLLKKGADIESKDNRGQTPLFYAAGAGNSKIVKLLLEKGANIESKDNRGKTPLLYAVGKHQVETVEILLENGAHVKPEDADKTDVCYPRE